MTTFCSIFFKKRLLFLSILTARIPQGGGPGHVFGGRPLHRPHSCHSEASCGHRHGGPEHHGDRVIFFPAPVFSFPAPPNNNGCSALRATNHSPPTLPRIKASSIFGTIKTKTLVGLTSDILIQSKLFWKPLSYVSSIPSHFISQQH